VARLGTESDLLRRSLAEAGAASATRGYPFENVIPLSPSVEERGKGGEEPANHVSGSRSITVQSLLVCFVIPYSTHSQSSNVRWVCWWREVIPIKRRTKWSQTVSRRLFTCDRANLWLTRFRPRFRD
jgi:hypothetical protein